MSTRAFASGLMIAAFLIIKFKVFFEEWIIKTALYPELTIPLKKMLINTLSGKDINFHAVFIIGCLGISLFISSIFYPILENLLFGRLSFGETRFAQGKRIIIKKI